MLKTINFFEPSHETERATTLIDHTAINRKLKFVKSGVIKIGVIDHYLVYATRKFLGNVKKQHSMVTSGQMKLLATGNFIHDLASLDWQLVLRFSAHVNDIASNWRHVFASIIEKHALLRERRVSDRLGIARYCFAFFLKTIRAKHFYHFRIRFRS